MPAVVLPDTFVATDPTQANTTLVITQNVDVPAELAANATALAELFPGAANVTALGTRVTVQVAVSTDALSSALLKTGVEGLTVEVQVGCNPIFLSAFRAELIARSGLDTSFFKDISCTELSPTSSKLASNRARARALASAAAAISPRPSLFHPAFTPAPGPAPTHIPAPGLSLHRLLHHLQHDFPQRLHDYRRSLASSTVPGASCPADKQPSLDLAIVLSVPDDDPNGPQYYKDHIMRALDVWAAEGAAAAATTGSGGTGPAAPLQLCNVTNASVTSITQVAVVTQVPLTAAGAVALAAACTSADPPSALAALGLPAAAQAGACLGQGTDTGTRGGGTTATTTSSTGAPETRLAGTNADVQAPPPMAVAAGPAAPRLSLGTIIAAAVVGGLVGAVLLALIAVVAVRRRKRRDSRPTSPQEDEAGTGTLAVLAPAWRTASQMRLEPAVRRASVDELAVREALAANLRAQPGPAGGNASAEAPMVVYDQVVYGNAAYDTEDSGSPAAGENATSGPPAAGATAAAAATPAAATAASASGVAAKRSRWSLFGLGGGRTASDGAGPNAAAGPAAAAISTPGEERRSSRRRIFPSSDDGATPGGSRVPTSSGDLEAEGSGAWAQRPSGPTSSPGGMPAAGPSRRAVHPLPPASAAAVASPPARFTSPGHSHASGPSLRPPPSQPPPPAVAADWSDDELDADVAPRSTPPVRTSASVLAAAPPTQRRLIRARSLAQSASRGGTTDGAAADSDMDLDLEEVRLAPPPAAAVARGGGGGRSTAPGYSPSVAMRPPPRAGFVSQSGAAAVAEGVVAAAASPPPRTPRRLTSSYSGAVGQQPTELSPSPPGQLRLQLPGASGPSFSAGPASPRAAAAAAELPLPLRPPPAPGLALPPSARPPWGRLSASGAVGGPTTARAPAPSRPPWGSLSVSGAAPSAAGSLAPGFMGGVAGTSPLRPSWGRLSGSGAGLPSGIPGGGEWAGSALDMGWGAPKPRPPLQSQRSEASLHAGLEAAVGMGAGTGGGAGVGVGAGVGAGVGHGPRPSRAPSRKSPLGS